MGGGSSLMSNRHGALTAEKIAATQADLYTPRHEFCELGQQWL